MRINSVNSNAAAGKSHQQSQPQEKTTPERSDSVEISKNIEKSRDKTVNQSGTNGNYSLKDNIGLYKPVKAADNNNEGRIIGQPMQDEYDHSDINLVVDQELVRVERVELARQKLVAGEYETPAVLERIVDRLIDQFEI